MEERQNMTSLFVITNSEGKPINNSGPDFCHFQFTCPDADFSRGIPRAN
jgi:hypothetical protein